MDFFINLNTKQEGLKNVEKKKFFLKKRIVNYLYFHGYKSAAQITKKIKSSIPTVKLILDELIEEDILTKKGKGDSEGGRRPVIYGLKEDAFYILGIDIGHFTTKMAIFNTKLENITEFETFPLKPKTNSEQTSIIVDEAEKLIVKSKIIRKKIIGVGIDMPGLVDSKKGYNYTYFNTDDSSLTSVFEEKFKLPVFIENDAKARALAEYRYGKAKHFKNTLVLHIGWGLGLGMILDKKVFRGSSGFAGEFSHIPMVQDGVLCSCGKQGCLETVASGKALVRLANEGLKNGHKSTLNKIKKGGREIIPKMIIDAADNGDQFSISILSKIGFELGKGLAILIQLFNPDLIILGGRVADANKYLFTPIDQALNFYSISKVRNQTKIVSSNLGSNAPILGAVAMVVENVFEK